MRREKEGSDGKNGASDFFFFTFFSILTIIFESNTNVQDGKRKGGQNQAQTMPYASFGH